MALRTPVGRALAGMAAASAAGGWRPPPALRGFFGGSGRELVGSKEAADAIISLSGKATPAVLYLGTATYDLPKSREAQTSAFVAAGCPISALEVTHHAPLQSELEEAISAADVLLVSGGNTLWAVDRWKSLGLALLMHKAMLRGAVLAGGSAGAICWFDGGHSDSMDPHSYLATPHLFTGESGDAPGERPSWAYIRINGLGFLPGLVCPHHDRTQSNGTPRSEDFDAMLLRHPGEQGLCIDHFAALIVEGDSYQVLSLPEKEGSVREDGSLSRSREGRPGIWLKSVGPSGAIEETLVPPAGSLAALLRPAAEIVEDPRAETCRHENPQPADIGAATIVAT